MFHMKHLFYKRFGAGTLPAPKRFSVLKIFPKELMGLVVGEHVLTGVNVAP